VRRRIVWFTLGLALAVGPVAAWLFPRSGQPGEAIPLPRLPNRFVLQVRFAPPRPRIPPNHLPDPEPPFVPVAPFAASATGEPALVVPKSPEVKPLAPAVVPTLSPAQRLGDRRHRGPAAFGPPAVSADGTTAAFGSGVWHGPELWVWDLAAGRELGRMSGSHAQVALSPNGRALYTGGSRNRFRGGKLVVWDVHTGKVVRERPTALWALSADGKTLATVDIHIGTFDRMHRDEEEVPWRSTLAVWNAADFTLRSAFTYTAFVPDALALSADGSKAVCASRGTVTAFETVAGKPLWKRELTRTSNDPWNEVLLTVSPDGSAVAAGHQHLHPDHRTVRLLDMANGKDRVLVEFAGRAFYSVPQLVGMNFTPDGKTLWAGFDGGTVSVELAAGEPVRPGAGNDYVIFQPGLHPTAFTAHGFALSADGKTAIFTGRSEANACGLRVVDMETRAVKFPPKIERIAAPFPPVNEFPDPYRFPRMWKGRLLPNGRRVLMIMDRDLVFEDQTGHKERIGPGDTLDYAVSPDGETIVTRGLREKSPPYIHDPQLRFRDTGGNAWGEAVGPAPEQLGGGRALAMSADGRTLAALHPDGGIWLWEVATTKPRLRLDRAGPEDIFSFTFSRDGRYLMSNDYHAQTGLVWDLSGAAGEQKGAPDAAELAKLWDALRDEDASAAYRAAWRLAKHPAQAIPFLKDKAKDVPAVADPARRALRPFELDIVNARRVVEVLELCGTPEAAALLKEFVDQPAFAAPAAAALGRVTAK
jgi:WD40 repeat protein